ncbi:MAG: methyltransferase domain-containing protein [Gammaproteobacteria bacterium]|nr:methyltransferase domain-containing protein [Gammaproteobacteria bacterium]
MSQLNQPDWEKIAEKFDLWLPHLAPVGEVLLDKLAAQPGNRILDVASGTGEPALTLAQRMGNRVTITGTDAAAALVRVAQNKAQQLRLNHLQFETLKGMEHSGNDAHHALVLRSV